MVDIRPNALPDAIIPLRTGDELIVDQGADGVRKVDPFALTDSTAPVSTQSEAQVGTDNVKRMTPLRTKQSIASEVGVSIASKAQGDKADSAVQSVNGKSGNAVTLVKGDVGLGNVDNTSDLDKPISTATQTALNAKANSSVTISAGTGLTGGGSLAANRTLALSSASIASLAKADSSVQTVNGVAPIGGNVSVSAEEVRIQDSRASAILESFAGSVNFVQTAGYYAPGDGGGALYKRVSSEPSHAGKFQSADGAWWEIAEISFNIMMFGARKGNVNTYAAANTAAIQAAIDTAHAMGVREVIVPTGVFVISTKITMPTTYNVNLRGYGRGSQIKGGTGYSGEIILYGGATSTGGILGRIADMTIGEVLSGTCNGVFARNANTGQITGIYFRGCDTCIVMENSFSLKVHLCDFSVPSSYAIASLTGCHNLLVDTCWVWTSGLAAIYIAGISFNIVITNCDIEYCRSVIQTDAEVRSLIFVGNYVEGSVDREFNFGAPVYGFTCDNNVIELRGAVPGSGVGSAVESTYINIRGGSFRYNTMYEQKIAFGASCEGIEVIPGRITYNEGAGGSDRSYLKDQLYKTTAFINGWADGATYPFGFQRSGSKVRVKGSLLAGSGSADNPAFVLPPGYFPDTQKRIACMTSTGAAVAVIIDAVNGNFVPQTAAPGTTVYMDFEYHCIQPLP